MKQEDVGCKQEDDGSNADEERWRQSCSPKVPSVPVPKGSVAAEMQQQPADIAAMIAAVEAVAPVAAVVAAAHEAVEAKPRPKVPSVPAPKPQPKFGAAWERHGVFLWEPHSR